jgi:single-strand DNA-binding protein
MAGSLNKVMIIGNVGRDPEMRYTSGGQPITTFSVAASRRWRDPEGQDKEETEWFNVVAWQKLAETVNQIVTKGRKVYVEGRLQTRSWDGQDGQKHYRTEVVANTVIMIDRRPDSPAGAPAATHAATNGTAASSPWGNADAPAPDLDDIPF